MLNTNSLTQEKLFRVIHIEVHGPRIIMGINDKYYIFTVIHTLLEFYIMLLGSYSMKTIWVSTQEFGTNRICAKAFFKRPC